MSNIEEVVNLKEISERFNNGTETIEDIMNYCTNYEIKFENRSELRVVDKRYFDKLVERIKELETVLSMLKENSAEIEKKNTELAEKNAEIEELKMELEKKDKQIDLMAKFINKQNTIMIKNEITCIKNIYEIIGFNKYEKDIKRYFEKLAKEKE